MLWNDSLLIGIDKIDNQHKELINRIEKFLNACNNQKGKEEIESTLDFLAQYVNRHFLDEQFVHKSVNYPKAAEHKRLHDEFIERLTQLTKKIHDGGKDLNAILSTNRLVVDWVINHIRASDKEFADYYKRVK